MLSGPMFESSTGSVFNKTGAHYNIYEWNSSESMDSLRKMFPDAKADDLNFVLFSTSGVHGTYATIEDVERVMSDPSADGIRDITFVVVHPRLVCMRYGNVTPESSDDIAFLKELRRSSWEAVLNIGKEDTE